MIYAMYFSPTGGTKQVMEQLAGGFANQTTLLDITVQPEPLSLSAEDVCLVGVPSFGGRAPKIALERRESLSGNGAKAVAVVVYGNRHYDDTLLELQDQLEARGCTVIAGVAALAEHSVVREFAAGRPDADDAATLQEFAAAISKKLEKGGAAVQLPGNRPYKEVGGVPFHPVASERCGGCGTCVAECPAGAIPVDAPHTTDAALCFTCLRCVSKCPAGARALPDAVLQTMAEKLRPVCEMRKENELFL